MSSSRTAAGDSAWAVGPSTVLGRDISDPFFDTLRGCYFRSRTHWALTLSLADEYELLSKPKKLFYPNALLSPIVKQLKIMQAQVSLVKPVEIGPPYLYNHQDRDLDAIIRALDYYASALDLGFLDTTISARYHHMRNEVCKVLGRDPLVRGELDEELLQCFKTKGLSGVKALNKRVKPTSSLSRMANAKSSHVVEASSEESNEESDEEEAPTTKNVNMSEAPSHVASSESNGDSDSDVQGSPQDQQALFPAISTTLSSETARPLSLELTAPASSAEDTTSDEEEIEIVTSAKTKPSQDLRKRRSASPIRLSAASLRTGFPSTSKSTLRVNSPAPSSQTSARGASDAQPRRFVARSYIRPRAESPEIAASDQPSTSTEAEAQRRSSSAVASTVRTVRLEPNLQFKSRQACANALDLAIPENEDWHWVEQSKDDDMMLKWCSHADKWRKRCKARFKASKDGLGRCIILLETLHSCHTNDEDATTILDVNASALNLATPTTPAKSAPVVQSVTSSATVTASASTASADATLLSTLRQFLNLSLAKKVALLLTHQGITASLLNNDLLEFLNSKDAEWGDVTVFEKWQVKKKLAEWLQSKDRDDVEVLEVKPESTET